jgi:hypothetical protein
VSSRCAINAMMLNTAPKVSTEPTTVPAMIHLMFEDRPLSEIGLLVIVVILCVLSRVCIDQ